MISKELFVSTIEEIEKEMKRIDAFNDALSEACDGFPIITIGSGYLDALLDVLNAEFGESGRDSTISWWLFEDVEKKIWISPKHPANNTGKEIEVDVSTPDRLYDYLVQYN